MLNQVVFGKILKKVKMIKVVRIFNSLNEENIYNAKRMAEVSISERLDIFGVLQARVFGERWTTIPIKKIVSFEKVNWYKKCN